jgi:hypothetical protein
MGSDTWIGTSDPHGVGANQNPDARSGKEVPRFPLSPSFAEGFRHPDGTKERIAFPIR